MDHLICDIGQTLKDLNPEHAGEIDKAITRKKKTLEEQERESHYQAFVFGNVEVQKEWKGVK